MRRFNLKCRIPGQPARFPWTRRGDRYGLVAVLGLACVCGLILGAPITSEAVDLTSVTVLVKDAETGKPYWTFDAKAHIWGSTLVADGKVYVGDEDGDFTVLAATKGKKLPADKVKPGGLENEPVVINETNLGSPVYGTPVVANGVIYVGSQTHLYAFYDQSKGQHTDEAPKLNIDVK